jgi:5'-nucleotidase / UDP-sugar diphosphatase
MRRSLTYAIALAAVFSMTLFSCRTVTHLQGGKEKSIVVLYENDVHCGVDGYAKLAGLRNAIADTAYVAVVSCGDFLQGGTVGAISEGRYIIDIMRRVGYDAVTLGNHEFDYKTPRMFSLLDFLQTPVTSVNLRDLSTNQFCFAPYVIKTFGNRKVAFVGATTPTTMETEAYAFFDENDRQLFDLCTKDVYRLVQNAADKARKEGADYVVVLSHLGEDTNNMDVDSHGLIRHLAGVDAVLDGHTHSVIPSDTVHNKFGQSVGISQTGTKFANIGKLLITPKGKKTLQLIPTSEITQTDAAVKHVTDSINALVAKETDIKVCDSEVALTILDANGNQEVRKGETNAGDLVADAMKALTGADIAMLNGGGIRCGLPAGELSYGDIISMLPYDNTLCTVEITGRQLLELLNACTKYVPQENGDFPQVAGMKFTIDKSGGNGVTDVTVQSRQTDALEPLDLGRTYTLATIEYCVTGGGFQGVLKKNTTMQKTGFNYCECLVRYLKAFFSGHIGKEYAAPQGRITIK